MEWSYEIPTSFSSSCFLLLSSLSAFILALSADLSSMSEKYQNQMKKVNKQCLLDTPRTVRVSEKTWPVIVRTRRP